MSFDISDDLSMVRNKFGIDFIQKMFTRMYKNSIQKLDDEQTELWVPHEDLIALHDMTETFTENVTPDDTQAEASGGIDNICYNRFLPRTVRPYAITHTDSGTFSFPETGLKHGGRVTCNGTQYIQLTQIGSTTSMDLGTGAFGFAFWVKNLGAGTYGILCKRDTAATTNAGVEIYFSGGNTVNCRIADGTNTTLASHTVSGIDLTEDSWHSVVVNVPSSGNIEILVDKVSQGTTARGSVTNVNNSRDAYVFATDNAGTIGNKLSGDISWICWKKGEVWSTAQITDFHEDGVLDLDNATDTEITTIPFLQNSIAWPNSQVGQFYA